MRQMNDMRLAALMRAQQARGRAKIKAVSAYMRLLSVQDRIGELVPLIEHEPAHIFWPAFSRNWLWCGRNTFAWNKRLRAAMQRVGPHASVDRMPERLTVFRGCSRSCVAGMSWTTKSSEAIGFALGFYLWDGPVPDPCVAMAHIKRDEAFWYHRYGYHKVRREFEVICRPTSWSIYSEQEFDWFEAMCDEGRLAWR